jgi:hypothetical protein
MKRTFLIWAGFVMMVAGARAETLAPDLCVTVHEIQVPMAPSSEYQLKVNGREIEVIREECNDLDRNGGVTVKHTAIFDYADDALVEVTCRAGFDQYTLLPRRLNIGSERDGQTITFKLADYYNYAVAIPGREPLLLFSAPPMEELTAGLTPQRTVTYAPGVHEIGHLYLESDTTYVLKPGAMLHGQIYLHNVSNVNVVGRGYMDDRTCAERGNFIQIYNSTNILLSGFAVRHAEQGWQLDPKNSAHINVSYLNLLSFGENNDGLDLGVGCQYVTYRDSFIGCGDDGFGWHAINAALDGEAPTRFCRAENCLIWKNQVGVGIRIGSSMEASEFSDLYFKNIDIANMDHGYAIAIPHSDWADVRRLTFENIYNESDQPFVLFYLRETMFSCPKGYRPGTISDVKFVECESVGSGAEFYGYDRDHQISNVLFHNVRFGGRYVTEDNIKRNEFTKGFKYVCEPETHELSDIKGYWE